MDTIVGRAGSLLLQSEVWCGERGYCDVVQAGGITIQRRWCAEVMVFLQKTVDSSVVEG